MSGRRKRAEQDRADRGEALDPEVTPGEVSSPDAPSVEELAEAAEAAEREEGGIEQLRRELEQKTREAIDANEKYLRTYADFENYRKRMQRDLAEFRKYANDQIALDLLPAVDHLGLAIQHAAEGAEANLGIIQGVELVLKQLRGVLEKYGIRQFKADGEPFNPVMHDAITQVERDDLPENTVAQVFQEGYLYHDKVLRHAKVGVSRRPPAERQPLPSVGEPVSEAKQPEGGGEQGSEV